MPYRPTTAELQVIVSSMVGNSQLLVAAKQSGVDLTADLLEQIGRVADTLYSLTSPEPEPEDE